MNIQIIEKNGRLLADSRDVAEMIGKDHKHLLRDIRGYVEIMCKSKIGLAEFFTESFYQDTQGKPRPHYFITRKGCDMVANKMTGEKGVLFTAAYVTRFEEMEKKLAQPFALPTNYKEALLQLVEQVEKNEHLQLQNAQKEQIINEMQPKATYYDLVLHNKTLVSISKIAKDFGMSGAALNKQLKNLGVQYKQGDCWLLYAQYQDRGYTQSKTHIIDSETSKMHTYWTQKGRLFIYELLKNKSGILPLIEREDTAS
ncbi:phage antirepressor KilAC domain-containing protein [Sutcliffiella horikoshii]|uniref:phage antirepressor KilAC domain-containing protein n=1 Tax=Sutcliffiella horikoshii TaxID=79883 RepID=UPI003CEC8F81